MNESLVQSNLVTFGLQILNTIVLFAFMKKLLFKPVTEYMQKRQKGIEDQLNKADVAVKEAEDYKREYLKKIEESKEEGQQIINEARKKGEVKSLEIIEEAKNEASKILKKANKEIELEVSKARNDLKDEVSQIALMAASKVIDKSLDNAEHERLIDDFIQEVGEVKWQN
ncbi:MAG: F0F1 ATP synthase subunit B [Peptostreptococcaceae bacterium]|nr:F0F1 ATP synthase subunit B [Peptostreptococcaceae bacterium]